MKKTRTRVLSALLVLCMVISMIPMAVFAAEDSKSGSGNLVGGKVYTLDTNGVTANKNYLIVNTNSGDGYALTNNNGTAGRTEVDISNSTITVEDDTDIAWVFSGSTSGTVSNDGRYVYPNNGSLSLNTDGTSLTISNRGNGAYRISRSGSRSTYYLRYSSNAWTGSTSSGNVYLYELTSSSPGEAVEFTVNYDTSNIITGSNKILTGVVEVGGTEVDLSKCTIAWASDKTGVATVSDGTVTGVADGTANITATLSAVDGTSLVTPITLTIPVMVQSKTITNVEVYGSPLTVNAGSEIDWSKLDVVVEYGDNTSDTLDGTVLTTPDVDTSMPGAKTVRVSYAGFTRNVTINVVISYDGLEKAEEPYPQYPNDGAVRIDKFASHDPTAFKQTGVTRVELDVAGISVKSAVDVILVADISNSMGWAAGKNNVAPATDANSKWNDLQDSAKTFIDVLLAEHDDGTPSNNTVSFVMFGGYDAQRNTNSNNYTSNFDATQTVFVGASDADTAKAGIDKYAIRGSDSAGYTVYVDGNESSLAPQGGTNYDYAFLETASAITQLKSQFTDYDNSDREIYVIFLTDGAPDHYNQLYYKSRTSSQFDYYAQYRNGTDFLSGNYFTAQAAVPTDLGYTFSQNTNVTNGYYMPTGNNVAVSEANWTKWIQSDSLYVAEEVLKLPKVNSITSIGFDLANGGFNDYTFGETVLESVLANLAGPNSCDVLMTSDSSELNAFYAKLAQDIRYAGTSAQVTDIVDSDFNVQLGTLTGSPVEGKYGKMTTAPTMTVTAYDLYPKGSTDEEGNDITGDRTGTSSLLEEVTFTEEITRDDEGNIIDYKITGAYSSVLGSDVNILTTDDNGNITIAAKYFTYTLDAETEEEKFIWTIGNITDKEIALAFDAYLTGTMEGTREDAVYYTNEEAVLEYIDIDGKYATQTFPVPPVGWGGATTTIRFYLVNEKGEPVNRQGQVIPWANRIYVGDPITVSLNLNADMTIGAQTIQAAAHVPSEYFLYDNNASYTVQSSTVSDVIVGGITPSTPSEDAYKTTSKDGTLTTQTGAQTTRVIDYEPTYYTYSTVGFGVRWDMSAENTDYPLALDEVVIDYGKKIQIDVMANDPTDYQENGHTAELVGFTNYKANTNLAIIQHNPGSESVSAAYGDFSIVDGKVQYQPTKIVNNVDRVFYVVKYSTETDTFYLWGELRVIPATNVYYETDFATGVFTMEAEVVDQSNVADADKKQYEWITESEGAAADGPQDYGTVGASQIAYADNAVVGDDQTYGYDSTYTNDAYLSNGTSYFVQGQGYITEKTGTTIDPESGKEVNTYKYIPKTQATFSFTGTGFELYSRTGAAQGLIKVIVTDEDGNDVKTISVLNKSESDLELYQIPVVSINDMPHGEYDVTVSVDAEYKNTTGITALDSLNRGDEFYFDAIRIYDPINIEEDSKDALIAEDAYIDDGEAYDDTTEIRSMLLDADTFNAITGSKDGMVFIDRDQSEKAVIATYATIGPNNETYLAEGQAVAFMIDATTVPASIDVGAKSITGAAAELSAVVTDTATTSYSVVKEIASSTAQYINLMNDTTVAAMDDNTACIIITNTGAGVLSITDIKVAYASVAEAEDYSLAVASETGDDPYAVTYSVDASTFALARSIMAVSEEVPEVTEPEATEPEATEPEATEPEVTEPEATEPEVTEPEVTEPEATEPEATEPKEDDSYNPSQVVTVIFNKIFNELSSLLSKWFK